MYQHDKLATNNYLTKFSNLMRKVLENSQHTSIPLADELNALNLYLELECIRFKDKFDFEIKVDDDIDPSDPVQVEYAMATRFQADRNLTIIEKVRGSSLDPSSDQKNLLTAKLGIDATRPLDKRQEGFEIAEIPGNQKYRLDKYLK